jgi:hypothetical protein
MKPPPGNGTAVKPGMTGAAAAPHAAGPKANWLVQPLSVSERPTIAIKRSPRMAAPQRRCWSWLACGMLLLEGRMRVGQATVEKLVEQNALTMPLIDQIEEKGADEDGVQEEDEQQVGLPLQGADGA